MYVAGKMRYTVFDKARKMWLAGFQRPEKQCDAAVTRWTRKPDHAMRFPGAKSARGVARWIDSGAAGNVVVRNAKGEAV